MLISKPTKHAAGISIYGDYYDLQNLHKTIHKITDSSPLSGGMQDFLLGLAYDIRHAYQQDRLEKSFGTDEYDTVIYRGENILWPVFLFQVGLLRWAAAFLPTSKVDQANLYLLENCAESALTEYEPKIAKECLNWLNSFSGISQDYYSMHVTEVCYRYIFGGNAGKTRFNRLPQALNELHPLSSEYSEFKTYIESLAKEKKCDPEELHGSREWPDFKW